MNKHATAHLDKLTAAGLLVAVGIVFGDIGTSPLYTYRAIIEDRSVTETLALGGASAIFWTLTFQTTLKYVFITLRADNNGEGGIFSLYTLIRRYGKWLLFPAIAGGSFLIADSIITPPISVSSAIEGLLPLYPDLPTVPIVLAILLLLFVVQQAGTNKLGNAFGPIMVVWFTMIGVIGLAQVVQNPAVVRALNPYYAYNMIVNYPEGFWLLGGVFLCSTGAEALYSDMGHVGRKNVQISWVYVKVCLILCYLGQAAWLLQHLGKPLGNQSPFFGLIPGWFLLPSIGIATLATIIASQALISGTFTLVSEAFRLTLLPKMRIVFPSDARGQVYIPAFNWLLMAGCFAVVLYFRESKNMEAAFGLSVNLTMLMTTVLLAMYLYTRHINGFVVLVLLAIYLFIEGGFLVANLRKFTHGGWVSLLLGAIMMTVMLVWHFGSRIKRRLTRYVSLRDHLPILKQLSNDESIPKYATNLVYLTSSTDARQVEEHIIDSILEGQPKRADVYWLIHVELADDPYTTEYSIDILEPEEVVRITFRLGFRVQPRINLLFRKVVEEMVRCGEVKLFPKYRPLGTSPNFIGDFRFIVINRFLSYENDLTALDSFVMSSYFSLKRVSLADERAYGLDTQNVETEQVPLIVRPAEFVRLRRVTTSANEPTIN
ncbi:KUP/HAK/KT family potassium transporter [Spirosoma montaniterrae]|uniref:Probable potassium transport system protein Kup n=1 Tax=Spirosoma montaniterrae TaxID=1178516 RepID=A0A1P9WTA4_9BACT|nr:KUP/HAK/KT family potassium transporter [Spirosoma montaniterrae]AQG78563.1 potassium transporter Kup [Spirosoma montaniterrae]